MGIFKAFKHKDNKKDSDKKNQKSLNDKKVSKQVKKDLSVAEITADKHNKSKSKVKKTKISKTDTKNAYKVLIKALITEKATYLKSENKYLFEVSRFTNKSEIKKAIYHVYGVWPIKINVLNSLGKNKRYGRTSGMTKLKKKAMVTLKQGDSIELYEGV